MSHQQSLRSEPAGFVEPLVPYDRSKIWELHDQYYRGQSAKAWGPGGIPSVSTNNLAMARQHARFLCSLYARTRRRGTHEADQPFYVLEIGAGLGLFAANLFHALLKDCGPVGTELASNLRFILSDYHAAVVQAAIAQPRLIAYQAQIIPALFDIRSLKLTDLAGRPLSHSVEVVFANYVCCVSPTKILRYQDGVWNELFVQLQQTEIQFKIAAQNRANHSSLQQAPLKKVWRPLSDTTTVDLSLLDRYRQGQQHLQLAYPYAFIEFMKQLPQIFGKQTKLIVSDFGYGPKAEPSTAEPLHLNYGNTLNHHVHFGLLETFRQHLHWSGFVTETSSRNLHHVYLTSDPNQSPLIASSFYKNYETCYEGEELTVLRAEADEAFKQREYDRAIHFALRCLEADPTDSYYPYLIARCFAALKQPQNAKLWLERGASLPSDVRYDFSRLIAEIEVLND